jgi:transcriptional regulator with XRE-family HTH domain
MTTIHERIKELLEVLHLTPYQFAKALGYERKDKVYNLVKGKTAPAWEMIEDIARVYGQVNGNWLLRGEGNMFKAEKLIQPRSRPEGSPIQIVTVDRQGEDAIVMVPYKAQAGYKTLFRDEAFLETLPAFSLPHFMKGSFRAFEVEGDSMTPTIRHADYVICSFVEKWEWLKPMNVYCLITEACVTVKRVGEPFRKGSEAVRLVSDNRFYDPFEVAWTDVYEIWQVRGILTSQIPANMQDVQQRVLEIVDGLDRHAHETQDVLRGLARELQERYLLNA